MCGSDEGVCGNDEGDVERCVVHRAVTLIEMLIALALLLAIAALVYPVVHTRIAGAQFDESLSQVVALFRQARAEAQQSGRPVVVEYETSDREFVIRVLGESTGDDVAMFEGDMPGDFAGSEFGESSDQASIIGFEGERATRSSFSANGRRSNPGASEFGVDVFDDLTESAREAGPVEGWWSLTLPEGCRVVWSGAGVADEAGGSSNSSLSNVEAIEAESGAGAFGFEDEAPRSEEEAMARSGSVGSPSASGPIRVAIFLPDGSVMGDGVTITGAAGTRRRITLNQWTGLASISDASATSVTNRVDEDERALAENDE